jgi:crossover junction endodeoxyribonuclease RuvC
LSPNSKIILGIDPGTVIMGFGLIKVQGQQIEMLEMNAIKLNAKKDMYERLGIINKVIQELIDKHQPNQMAIEAPFFGKNVQSMLKLGRAQGVAIAVAMANDIPVSEYSPKKVKQAITGNGNASKDEILKMLSHIVPLSQEIKHFDASDALAVAICHHFNSKSFTPKSSVRPKSKQKKTSEWENFIKRNPNRIIKP